MGRVGRLIQSAIGKFIVQTVEVYAGVNLSAETFAASGDDSPPLPADRIVLVQVDGTGNFAAVGTLVQSQGAKPGEKIMYSRDAGGEVKAVLKLLNDGKVVLSTPAAVEVKNDGDVAVKAAGTASVEASEVTTTADKITINGAQTVLTGGQLRCEGAAAASGSGPFCAIPACLFTGAPQCGTDVSGT